MFTTPQSYHSVKHANSRDFVRTRALYRGVKHQAPRARIGLAKALIGPTEQLLEQVKKGINVGLVPVFSQVLQLFPLIKTSL